MKLTLPLMMENNKVPTWNHIFSNTRFGGKILNKYALKYKETITEITKQWVHQSNWQKTENKQVIVRICVYYPNLIRRDCHNLDKIVLDSFNDVIFDDDCNALVQYIAMDIDKLHPRFEIEFEIGKDTIWKKKKGGV